MNRCGGWWIPITRSEQRRINTAKPDSHGPQHMSSFGGMQYLLSGAFALGRHRHVLSFATQLSREGTSVERPWISKERVHVLSENLERSTHALPRG